MSRAAEDLALPRRRMGTRLPATRRTGHAAGTEDGERRVGLQQKALLARLLGQRSERDRAAALSGERREDEALHNHVAAK